ncbi:MAG: hypothetical protein PVF58_12155 [Candidatus Methanofastidiosia archaeon]
MKRMKGMVVTAIIIFSIVAMCSPVGGNTIASSTMVFEGPLTDHGGGVYSGTILGVKDFDVFAKVGSIIDSDASSIDGDPVGADHDAYPNWDPDVPDVYDDGDGFGGGYYALNLNGNTWALWYLQTPGDPSSGPASYMGDTYDPFHGHMDWAHMCAVEDGQNWEQTWTWGSENIALQYPGFHVEITSIGQGQYRVILTPAFCPAFYTEQPVNYWKSMCPLAVNNIGKAENLLETVQDMFDEAQETDLDVSEAEELIEEAKELLEKAKMFCKNSQNCLAGNTLAIEAQKLLQEAQEMLESMIS